MSKAIKTYSFLGKSTLAEDMKIFKPHSFYDVDEEERTEEELQDYKRFVGMPLTEDYDELIASLK